MGGSPALRFGVGYGSLSTSVLLSVVKVEIRTSWAARLLDGRCFFFRHDFGGGGGSG